MTTQPFLLYIVEPGDLLTPAEVRELLAWAEGLTEAQAAERHHVSVSTVHSHRQSLHSKTGVRSGMGVFAYFLLTGHIRPLNIKTPLASSGSVSLPYLRVPGQHTQREVRHGVR